MGWSRNYVAPKPRVKDYPVQIFARITGSLQWLCPNCYELYKKRQVNYRTTKLKCERCERTYRLGLLFQAELEVGRIPPFNALSARQPYSPRVHNGLEQLPPGAQPHMARLVGMVEWRCPRCATNQKGHPEFHTCGIVCERCEKVWYVRPIIYLPHKYYRTPVDWILPRH
jgi:hypothetical protein